MSLERSPPRIAAAGVLRSERAGAIARAL